MPKVTVSGQEIEVSYGTTVPKARELAGPIGLFRPELERRIQENVREAAE